MHIEHGQNGQGIEKPGTSGNASHLFCYSVIPIEMCSLITILRPSIFCITRSIAFSKTDSDRLQLIAHCLSTSVAVECGQNRRTKSILNFDKVSNNVDTT